MGCFQSQETKKNVQIEKAQKQALSNESRIVKLLLLGAGESGKSTLFKQMKLLYGEKYASTELKKLVSVVHLNVLSNMFAVLQASSTLKVPFEDEERKAKFIEMYNERTPVNPEVASALYKLWRDPGCKELWNMRARFQVLDCLSYYMEANNLKRIAEPDYEPTEMDVLHARVRTSGVVEEKYIIDGVNFAVFDVGGQRNERKKWIHCFENVTALIFVAAINEYDQVLFEDSTVSRISESLILFEEVANSQWFEETSLILFLNKIDLFQEKLLTIPVRVPGERFEDFAGPYVTPGADPFTDEFKECADAAKEYFKKKFTSRCRHKRPIYCHYTCATDNKTTKIVFNAVKDIILRANLADTGFIQ